MRPARLPFAWQALEAAQDSGDGREAFARGQQILDLLPSWTLGHAAFAYRYVLTQDVRDGDIAERRQITIGGRSLSAIEVTSGLEEGDRVIISSIDQFRGAETVLITD